MEKEIFLGDSIISSEDKMDWEREMRTPKVLLDRAEIDPGRRDKIVCWDIETYKWEEKPLIIEGIVKKAGESYVKPDIIKKYQDAALEKLALDPLTGQIILSGFYNGEELTHYQGSEESIIKDTLNGLVKILLDGCRLVTKGGKRFDLPYLLTRAGILGIKAEIPYGYKDLFGKYSNFYHVDLETIFEKHSLGTLAYAFGLVDVPGNKGGEIAGMYESGNMDAIIQKNTDDLVQSYNIYQRIKWINL